MKDFFGLPSLLRPVSSQAVEMLKNHLASFDPATLGLAAASLALILFWLNGSSSCNALALILATRSLLLSCRGTWRPSAAGSAASLGAAGIYARSLLTLNTSPIC